MARITSRHHPDGEHTPPRLLEPSEVAAVLGCSEWWVKEQARRRRIPFTKVGGAYRFTDEHLYEIIRIFEQRPVVTQAPDADTTAPRRSKVSPQPVAPVVQLRARHPRRARKAG
jgi:excisionase family DNA binding protein